MEAASETPLPEKMTWVAPVGLARQKRLAPDKAVWAEGDKACILAYTKPGVFPVVPATRWRRWWEQVLTMEKNARALQVSRNWIGSMLAPC